METGMIHPPVRSPMPGQARLKGRKRTEAPGTGTALEAALMEERTDAAQSAPSSERIERLLSST